MLLHVCVCIIVCSAHLTEEPAFQHRRRPKTEHSANGNNNSNKRSKYFDERPHYRRVYSGAALEIRLKIQLSTSIHLHSKLF